MLPLALISPLFGHGGGGGAEFSKHSYSLWAMEHAEYRCDAYRQGMNWDVAFNYANNSARQGWRSVFVSYSEKMKAFNVATKNECKIEHIEAWNANKNK